VVPPFFAADGFGDLKSDAENVLSSANGARSGPAYPFAKARWATRRSIPRLASVPIHTKQGSLNQPGRVLVLVNVFVC
jgi:hypothetical protein